MRFPPCCSTSCLQRHSSWQGKPQMLDDSHVYSQTVSSPLLERIARLSLAMVPESLMVSRQVHGVNSAQEQDRRKWLHVLKSQVVLLVQEAQGRGVVACKVVVSSQSPSFDFCFFSPFQAKKPKTKTKRKLPRRTLSTLHVRTKPSCHQVARSATGLPISVLPRPTMQSAVDRANTAMSNTI
jgi:hypothetical protein